MSEKSASRKGLGGRDEAPSKDPVRRREITSAELRAAEREKVRLSIELHDGIGQQLTGIAFLTKALANRLSERTADEAPAAAQIVALTNQAINNVRAMARGLRPVGPEDNALYVALTQLAADTSRVYGVQCRHETDSAIVVASPVVSHHLYRIAQEAVHNAIKHGTAGGRISVELAERGEQIVLTVVNRGEADIQRPRGEREGPGIGIASMRYRAALIHARMSLENMRSGNVRVRVTLPREIAQSLQETEK